MQPQGHRCYQVSARGGAYAEAVFSNAFAPFPRQEDRQRLLVFPCGNCHFLCNWSGGLEKLLETQ